MPKKKRGTGHAASRAQRRKAALAVAADAASESAATSAAESSSPAVPAATVPPTSGMPAPTSPPAARVAAGSRERAPSPRRRPALLAGALVALAGVVALLVWLTAGGAPPTSRIDPGIVVGTPGGAAFDTLTPTPEPAITSAPTPEPTPSPTSEPTPVSTPVASPAPATPAPAAPAPTQPPAPAATPTPAPVVVVAAARSPADAVAAFYGHVVSSRFDQAYALWSSRMRATYPRQENLDERFDQTASIAFEQLYVAEQTATTATVQANFVETYDGGSSRRFIGYWELILVEGRWLLDAPHY